MRSAATGPGFGVTSGLLVAALAVYPAYGQSGHGAARPSAAVGGPKASPPAQRASVRASGTSPAGSPRPAASRTATGPTTASRTPPPPASSRASPVAPREPTGAVRAGGSRQGPRVVPPKTPSRLPEGAAAKSPPLRDQSGQATPLPALPPRPSHLALALWSQVASLARGELSDVRKRRFLIRLLGRNAKAAQHDAHLWRAYALGSLLLGREDLALRWLRRGYGGSQSDVLWLADFAAALAYDGRLPAAKWIARRALRRLRGPARELAGSPAASAPSSSEQRLSRAERELLRTYVRLLRFGKGPKEGAWFLADVLPITMARSLGQDLLAAWNDSDGLASRGFEAGRLYRLRPPEPQPVVVTSPPPGAAPPLADAGAVASKPAAVKTEATPDDEDEDEDDEDEDDDDDDNEVSNDEDEDDDDDDDGEDEDDEEAAAGLAAVLAASDASVPTVIEAEDESEDPDSDRRYAITAGLDISDLNGLTLVGGSVRADFTLGRLGLPRFGLGLRASYVWFSDTHDWLPLYNVGLELGEVDLATVFRFRLPQERGRIEVGVGGNLRTSHAVPYAWLHGEYAPKLGLGSALLFELNLGVNQIIADTNELRLLGTRDRAQLGIDWDLTAREFLNVFFGWQRYQSRRRELLSDGYTLYAELGHRLRLANPGWSVRLSGYLEGSNLQPGLPAWVARKVRSDEAITVDDIVVGGFGMVGLGTSLRRGPPGIAPADDRRFRYFIDVWAGYLFPLDQVGFDLQLGLGYSRPKLGEISLSGYLSNSRFGGGREGASAGLSLRYVY